MTAFKLSPYAAAFLAFMALPAAAFDRISTKSEFVQAVSGKNLTIFGISVNVQPNGAIGGRAYGRKVQGQWQWRDGFFCRDLFWGDMDLGPNCQVVQVKGNVIRFQSDKGAGRYADLTMR